MNRLDISNEPNQEIQLDFASPIKSKTRGEAYILVADDRFSEWPTAQICKNTDSRSVVKNFNKILFRQRYTKSKSHRQRQLFQNSGIQNYCNGEIIQRIRCTPNLHTGTRLVERTIRTIKFLTRAHLQDGLNFA